MASRDVDVILRALDGFVEKLVVRVSVEVTAQLVEDTPVDTGWARANWVPQIGSPREVPVGTRQDAENGYVDHQAQQEAIVRLLSYRLGQGTAARQVWITNNVWYVMLLNAGSSPQQPQPGYIERGIEKGILSALRRVERSAA